MIKMICTMNRKAGLSMAEFMTYYEENHVPLIKKLLPYSTDYRRNYADGESHYVTGNLHPGRPEGRMFDVLTEIWFETEELYQKMSAGLADPQIAKIIAEDEEKFFDRASMRAQLVDERKSSG